MLMEHRDPSRIVRWIAHLGARRSAPGRVVLLGLVAASALILLVVILNWAAHASVAWLALQPGYRRHFREIELDPPAPGFLRSGSAGLLEQVRAAARWPADEPLALSLDLQELARLFRNHCPWVLDVAQVRRTHHNHLIVRLTYRQPILYLAADAKPNTPQVYLDRALVALPPEDIDQARAGPLLRLIGLDPPFDFLPGSTFQTTAPGDAAKLAAALKVATYLFDQMSRDPRAIRINLIDPRWGPHLVYVRTNDRLWVLWGNATGSERQGEATAAEKWARLRAWIARHGPNPRAQPPDGKPDRTGGQGPAGPNSTEPYLDLTGPVPVFHEPAARPLGPDPS